MNKKITRLILGTFLAISILTFCSCGSKSVDSKKLLDIEFSGLNTQGKATISFNQELLDDRDFLKEIFPDDSKKTAVLNLAEVYDSLSVTADKTSELSNGDTIKIRIDAEDENLLKEHSLKLSEAEFTIKVSGLTEVEFIDPFDGLSLKFLGTSPSLNVTIDDSNTASFVKNYVNFNFENKNYANGDTIEITATCRESDVLEHAIGLSTETKTYTIENQAFYVNSTEGIDLSSVQAEINDKLTAGTVTKNRAGRFINTSLGYAEFSSIKSSTLYSSHILTIKQQYLDRPSNGIHNQYIMIYDYLIERNTEEDMHVYVVAYVNNLVIDSDGTLKWGTVNDLKSFETYDKAVDTFINSNKDYYIVENF